MNNRKVLIAVAAVACTLASGLVVGLAYWYWTRQPAYSLRQAQKAVQQHDTVAFQKYVDVEAVVSSAVDQTMSASLKESGGADSLGGALGAGLIQMMKPRLVEAARTGLLRAVEGKPETTEGAAKPGDSPFSRAFANPSAFTVGETSVAGKMATVKLKIRSDWHEHDFTADIRMRDAGGHWQVTEVADLADLIAEGQRAEQRLLDQINKPIRERLAATVTIGPIQVDKRTGTWGIEKKLLVEFEVTNAGSKPISLLRGSLKLSTVDGSSTKESGLRREFETPLAPGAKASSYWELDVNMFDGTMMALFEAAPDGLKAALSVESVSFGPGGELRAFDSLAAARADVVEKP